MERRSAWLLLAGILVACGSEPASNGANAGGGADGGDLGPASGTPGDPGHGGDAGNGGDGGSTNPGDGGSTDGGTAITGDFCVEDRWCWQRPTPFGTSLFGVWGSAPDDVWTVGTRGTVVHYDGLGWKLVASGVRADLSGVWGTSKSDAWAVGTGGTLIHFDGKSWSSVASPTTKHLNAIHGASANDIYAVGDEDTRLHWDGLAWSALPTVYPGVGTQPNQYGVWAAASGDVWSAGIPYLQSVPHRSGGAWTTTAVDYVNSTAFKSVWGSGPSDVWMTGDPGGQGSLQHWTGTAWSDVYPPAASGFNAPAIAVTGSGPNDVWFFGGWYGSGRWDGSQFIPQPDLTYEYLTAGWVHPSGAGWTVGYGGRMAKKTTLAGGWSFVSGSPSGGYDSLGHIAVLSDNDAWVVGRLSIAHWNGIEWKDVAPATTNYRQEFNDVWGSGPTDVWATSWGSNSPDNLQHWNGVAWTTTAHPGPSYLDAVWGTAANDVWVSYSGGGMHYDGTTWQANGTGPGGVSIHGTSKTDVWSAGYSGAIRHFDGVTWTAKPSGTTEDLYVVRAFSPTDAWAAGANATLRHWNGTMWSAATTPPFSPDADHDITSLAGTGSTDLWATTSSGEVFHWNGANWTRSAWLSVGLSTIVRAPSGALFVSGNNGAIFRRTP